VARSPLHADGRLGPGSNGVVYAARHRDSGDEVALKTFAQRDPEGLYRLKQKFRACAGVRHPKLVALYELQVDDHACFLTMELRLEVSGC
jgi:serine/threonine-protein kinase